MAKYWKNICNIYEKQTQKGYETYGQRLEDNTELTIERRLQDIEEELIDALMYIEHLKEGLNGKL